VPWSVITSGGDTREYRDVRSAARILVAATYAAKGRGAWWGRVVDPDGKVALIVEVTPGEAPYVWAAHLGLGEHGFALSDAAKGRTPW
jgi:hypothetical protein